MTLSSQAWIITGPTAGIGHRTALELAAHGTVVLVGRDRGKLGTVVKQIEGRGGHAVPVVADLSDLTSVHRSAAEIIALGLPIAGLLEAGQPRHRARLRPGDPVAAFQRGRTRLQPRLGPGT